MLVMGLGAALMLGHGFVQDYAQALASPDGLYIPDARHVVPDGTPPGNYSHTFRIYNARPHSVVVEAQADCGCTGLSWNKATISPLMWKEIKVQFTPRANPIVGQSVLVHIVVPEAKRTMFASIIK